MIDTRRIRANPDEMRAAIRKRHVNTAKADLDRWLQLDEERRRLETALGGLNAERNRLADIGRQNPAAARERGREIREQARTLEERRDAIRAEWQEILDWFPNWPEPGMPEGEGEEQNREERVWLPDRGYLDESLLGTGATSAQYMSTDSVQVGHTGTTPQDHLAIGEPLGIDVAQAARVSGSRFAYLVGDIALLQLALHWLLIEKLLGEGFQPIIPPLLVREPALYGTSHFPEGRDQIYAIEAGNVEENAQLFLVGSSEPSNFSYFAGRILPEADLPIRLFADTPCFRSEVGSWGKDVRGIKRVHQFQKIELAGVCTPDQSRAVYDEFLGINEWLLQTLAIPYRVIDKCGGDAGYLASARQRDVEGWLAASHEFIELMTDTNTTDYQARRLNIQYRRADGTLDYCHTVNDTGASDRLLIALLDHYQQADGSLKVPDALERFVKRDYLRPAESSND